jgi:hypothetical protein
MANARQKVSRCASSAAAESSPRQFSKARTRELFFSTTDNIEEDQALDDALYGLRGNNCLFRVGNPSGNFILVSFKKCCFVQLVPSIDLG